MNESFRYASQRELWSNPRHKKPVSNKMIDKPLIADTFVVYGESLAIIAHFIAQTRESVAECIKVASFSTSVIEAVCICKFVGTSFGVDAVSVTRKMMGARALMEDSRLGSSSFVCNATCAAEGDNTIMELKVVGDLVKKGFSKMFPVFLLFKLLFRGHSCRKLVFHYVYCIIYAMWLGNKALDEGQLLRDIAWCRAHLCIISTFLNSGAAKYGRKNVNSMLQSYERLMIRFPTPSQF